MRALCHYYYNHQRRRECQENRNHQRNETQHIHRPTTSQLSWSRRRHWHDDNAHDDDNEDDDLCHQKTIAHSTTMSPRRRRRVGWTTAVVALSGIASCDRSSAFQSPTKTALPKRSQTYPRLYSLSSSQREEDGNEMHKVTSKKDDLLSPPTRTQTRSDDRSNIDRRGALLSLATTVMLIPSLKATAMPTDDTRSGSNSDPLEEILLGEGRWTRLDRTALKLSAASSSSGTISVPPAFCTYLTRFLIQKDAGVASWWSTLDRKYSLLSTAERQSLLSQSFGSLARSVELALEDVLESSNANNNYNKPEEAYEKLWDAFVERYGNQEGAMEQIAILFALLPHDHQPVSRLKEVVNRSTNYDEAANNSAETIHFSLPSPSSVTKIMSPSSSTDFSSLLPPNYHCVQISGTSSYYAIDPALPLGNDRELLSGKTAIIATPFGPLASVPLVREQQKYSLGTYALFGVCGATGCALTHSFVIPIDVVKTRNQVDPEAYKNFLGSAISIAKNEGLEGLLLGAQATIAGYFWYGLSVYPSYTLFKRALTLGPFLTPDVATVHANDIALIAGALAAVVASLGLTPLEAARIRVVAEPDKYRPLGLTGTLAAIAEEADVGAGWKALYAGLPSLMARQVIFGSVKFLAFERACDFIYAMWPILRDATWTALTVSLIAGGLSGALSSLVSQPADSVLTYVSQNSDGSASKLGVIEGCIVMVQKEGVGSLYRGLYSRCIWAGSIIAGQFLLYDVFRTYFGVNTDDLSQVYQVVIPTISK